jgi:hypothetical protein
MIPALAAGAVVGVITAPGKTAFVGKQLVKARAAFVGHARGKVREALAAEEIDATRAAALRQDLTLLSRSAKHGWCSVDELLALGRVSSFLGHQTVMQAHASLKEAFTLPN